METRIQRQDDGNDQFSSTADLLRMAESDASFCQRPVMGDLNFWLRTLPDEPASDSLQSPQTTENEDTVLVGGVEFAARNVVVGKSITMKSVLDSIRKNRI